MPDPRLRQLVNDLANAIHEIPSGEPHQNVVDRFLALITHLESTGQLKRGE
jgi:hypothetical protein